VKRRGQRAYPVTHLGWHLFYVARFNKTQHPDAAYLACLHLNFHYAYGGEPDTPMEENPMKFKTTYDYDSPGPAGPFKGWMRTPRRYKKGESISAPFGRATVKSSRTIDPTPSPWRQ
jgi:hypothetical protein